MMNFFCHHERGGYHGEISLYNTIIKFDYINCRATCVFSAIKADFLKSCWHKCKKKILCVSLYLKFKFKLFYPFTSCIFCSEKLVYFKNISFQSFLTEAVQYVSYMHYTFVTAWFFLFLTGLSLVEGHLRITNRVFTKDLLDPKSEAFQKLSSQIRLSVRICLFY